MPNIATLHPQIVHFVIALLYVGLVFRLLAFLPWFRWLSGGARTLIVVAAIAAYFAEVSGAQAHGPVERVPGARAAVQEHEQWGERARNAMLILAGVELLAWGLAVRQAKVTQALLALSAVGGIVTGVVLFEAAEHGGDLVYGYAGGVGIRSGEAADVDRLVVAGLYHGAMNDRKAGRPEAAARLIDELARRMPEDASVRLMVIESRLRDRSDARGALAALDSIQPAADDRRAALAVGMMKADAYIALGLRDSARLTLEALNAAGPSQRVQARIDSLR